MCVFFLIIIIFCNIEWIKKNEKIYLNKKYIIKKVFLILEGW
jgi:hypothetical protein